MQRNPWDRLDTESAEAWEAFCAYRDMGVTASLTTVAQQLHKTKAILGRWSAKYKWLDRVRAWETAKDRASTQTQLEAIKSDEQKRLDAVRRMNDRHAAVASTMVAKLYERLKNIDVAKLCPRDLAYWLEVAVKVERLARGAPAAELALTGQDGGAIEVTIQQQAAERVGSIIGEIVAEGQARGLVGKPN